MKFHYNKLLTQFLTHPMTWYVRKNLLNTGCIKNSTIKNTYLSMQLNVENYTRI